MSSVITIIAVMAGVGLFFGLVLAYANKKFAVEMNPLIHIVEDVLPKGQCGACGFAGCQAYAEAVVLDKEVEPNLCIPGKKAVAQKVAELTGKAAAEVEPRMAMVKCSEPSGLALKKYVYEGISDCLAASLLQSGPKECEYGCIGLGNCVRACVFGAIELNEEGLPVVDREKCTGCGKCASACPKQIIELVLEDCHVVVFCNSRDKGAVVRKFCKVACIACGLCVKNCPHQAIKLQNNLAVVDYKICIENCTDAVCMEKCSTKAIRPTYIIPKLEIDQAG
jgi:electron transport complex, RnfABCDGE type, B subunit